MVKLEILCLKVSEISNLLSLVIDDKLYFRKTMTHDYQSNKTYESDF